MQKILSLKLTSSFNFHTKFNRAATLLDNRSVTQNSLTLQEMKQSFKACYAFIRLCHVLACARQETVNCVEVKLQRRFVMGQ